MADTKRRSFLANSCQICKKLNTSYECGICRMIGYCSVEHRREDWYAHSHLCRAIFKLCGAKGVPRLYHDAVGASAEIYRQLRHRTAMECSKMLERQLQSWEFELLYWPKICGVCYRQCDWLDSCHGCAFVFACSEAHARADHAAWCSALSLYQDIVRHVETNGLPAIPIVDLPQPVTSMENILNNTKKTPVMNALISEVLTYPLTVLQALLRQPAAYTEVHVVGAELQAEVLPLHKWEHYLFHLLPACQQLRLVFIGPSLEMPEEILDDGALDVCKECRNQNKTLLYRIVANTLYHDFHSDVKPNLIVALNAGLYRNIGFDGADTWAPTLQKLFTGDLSNVPKLITEYTSHEIKQDADLVQKKFPRVKVLQAPLVNPFAGARPSLNIISDDDIPVIFKNYYLMLLA